MNPTVHTAEVLPARAMLFLGIVGFHVLLATLLAKGMIQATIDVLRPPMEGTILPPAQPPAVPTHPVENPTIAPTTFIAAVEPVIAINEPTDPASQPLLTSTEPQPFTPVQPVVPAEPPLRLVGRNVMPNTEDYYPAQERRQGFEGVAQVRSCVDANGRLDGTPVIESSSGRASFDNAAVRVARDGRYARAVRGETAVPNCYRFRVNFSMH
jgi:TonB family protein